MNILLTHQVIRDHEEYDQSNAKVLIELQRMTILFQTSDSLVCKIENTLDFPLNWFHFFFSGEIQNEFASM